MKRLRWLKEWMLWSLYVVLGGDPYTPGASVPPPTWPLKETT